MLRFSLLLLIASLIGGPALAQVEPTIKESQYSASETADRLQAAIEKAGARLVARVDHAANAETAGMTLDPTILMIFGNPKLGTPLMAENRLAGLELPLKVLIWEADSTTRIAYSDPETLKRRWNIAGQDEIFVKMSGALDTLTDAAGADK